MDPDEQLLRQALARGWLTADEARAALQAARARGVPALQLLAGRLGSERLAALNEEQAATRAPSARVAAAPIAAASAEVRPGQRRLGPYQLVRELARGGMGVVWVARRDGLDRDVALKQLLAGADADPGQVERFELEARVAARLKHPHIVAIHDVGRDGGTPWLVMDLIEGESLQARLSRDGPLPPREAAGIARDLARAIAYAHERGVLHRDLKPHNVLLGPGGPVLTDFGLAKDLQGEGRGMTRTGQVMGTPAYMPPEQAEGEAERIDRRSDVYGLGATLYALLTGRPPFEGSTALNLITAVLTKDPIPPRRHRPDLDRDLEVITLTCLEKEPERRYPTASALADDLEAWQADRPIAARRPGPAQRLRKWARRNRAASGALLAAGLLVLVGTGLAWAAIRARVAGAAEGRWASAAQLLSQTALPGPADEPALRRAALDRRMGAALAAWQEADAWRALTDDARAREASFQAALALAEAARGREQWSLAAAALERARALGPGPAWEEARAALERDERALTEEHLARTEELLAHARATGGQAWDDRELLRLAYQLAGWGDAAVVARLAGRLDELSDELCAATRAALAPDDAASSELDRWPGVVGERGPPPPPPGQLSFPREVERRLRAQEPGLQRLFPLLAAAQARALGPRLAPLRSEARLICEALGVSDSREQALAPLARYVIRQANPEDALPGAVALVRLGEGAHPWVEWAVRTHGPAFQERLARASGGFRSAARGYVAEAGDEREAALREVEALYTDRTRARGESLAAARAAADRHLARWPEDVRLLLARARIRRAARDLEGAAQDLDLALASAPGDPWARRERCDLRLERGENQAALEDAERLVASQPTSGDAACLRARAWGWKDPRARAELDRAAQLEPDSAPIWFARAQLRLMGGDLQGALGDVNRALELVPDQASYLGLRGQLRESTGDARGLEDLTRAVELAPGAAVVWKDRAVARARRGDFDAALADLNEALRLDPGQGESRINRALLHLQRGQPELALEDAAAAVQANPGNPDFLLFQAKVLLQRGELRRGEGALDQALALDPDFPEPYFLRAQVRAERQDLPGARADLERFLELAPRAPQAPEARAALERIRQAAR